MNLIDYIVLSGLAVVIAYIVIWIVRRKKQGKSSCGCCPQRDYCVKKTCD